MKKKHVDREESVFVCQKAIIMKEVTRGGKGGGGRGGG